MLRDPPRRVRPVTTPSASTALSVSSEAQLVQLRRLAWLLDSQFRVPGTSFRFGLDALVGLVPGFGDFAGAIASVIFLAQAVRMGAPRAVVGRMLANVATETVVGVIPGLGDLFDATFKANQRNMRLLERLAAAPGGHPPCQPEVPDLDGRGNRGTVAGYWCAGRGDRRHDCPGSRRRPRAIGLRAES